MHKNVRNCISSSTNKKLAIMSDRHKLICKNNHKISNDGECKILDENMLCKAYKKGPQSLDASW
jgi:hypothetical protein